ncbi:MAG: type II toxin-antitoxin system HicA family toxin [Acidobacteria bacterium]|nr:type II toxin-antitoxin system HicA family toxin [Acidobacteriota bacterium]MBI3658764.1 type II toxin-antitoxin system HicA family toxin [Acidobacteriota bacterium]
MAGLSPIHHKKLEKFAKSVGCRFERQEGSHCVYWRADQLRPVIIPKYKRVPVFIIRNILRQLNISVEEYLRILQDT